MKAITQNCGIRWFKTIWNRNSPGPGEIVNYRARYPGFLPAGRYAKEMQQGRKCKTADSQCFIIRNYTWNLLQTIRISMRQHHIPRLLILIAVLLTQASWIPAQETFKKPRYIPRVGQVGKDVIWVPTPDELVEKMLWSAQVTAEDLVIDLGSGDGRLVIAAAKIGAEARGVEYNPDMVELSRENAREAGVTDRATFIHGDIFEYDFSDATVITMFLLPSLNVKLRPKLLKMKPGTRIVSNAFAMGDWKPDYKATISDNPTGWDTALVWIVPSRVEGLWKFREGELEIRQEFQKFYGTYSTPQKTTNISGGSLYGDSISFSINGEDYTGHVTGETTMEGVVTSGRISKEWKAERIKN